jgi:hypothetical protein
MFAFQDPVPASEDDPMEGERWFGGGGVCGGVGFGIYTGSSSAGGSYASVQAQPPSVNRGFPETEASSLIPTSYPVQETSSAGSSVFYNFPAYPGPQPALGPFEGKATFTFRVYPKVEFH